MWKSAHRLLSAAPPPAALSGWRTRLRACSDNKMIVHAKGATTDAGRRAGRGDGGSFTRGRTTQDAWRHEGKYENDGPSSRPTGPAGSDMRSKSRHGAGNGSGGASRRSYSNTRGSSRGSTRSRDRSITTLRGALPASSSMPAPLIPRPQTPVGVTSEPPQPTFVPRDPTVQDGPWNAADARLVQAAQHKAPAAAAPAALGAAGHILLGKTLEELRAFAEEQGQPAYRGKQLHDAILQGARSIDDLRLVPKPWREQLKAQGVAVGRSILHHSVAAPDSTRKLLLRLADGRVVETVGIPVDDADRPRLTVCVSSQVGCPMRCTFCATGKGGFARHLRPHEIFDQVLAVSEAFGGQRVSNIVFMGMGEPLLNLASVVASFHLMTRSLGIGARHITISTVGVPQAIRRLAGHDLAATLAVSIHASNQRVREQLVPSAKAYPLQALLEDCVYYFRTTGRRVTFEYTLIGGINDTDEHAHELAALLRSYNMMSHVNLIPWNPVDESEFVRPSRTRVFAFKSALEAAGLPASVRSTRGLEAAAACGQLRNNFVKSPLEVTVLA